MSERFSSVSCIKQSGIMAFFSFYPVLLALVAVQVAWAGRGTDMSSAVSESNFNCMSKNGYGEFAVPRCWHSNGVFDSSACSTTKNAKAAGLTPHVYMFPCPLCSASCREQARWAVHNLTNCNAPYDFMWIDIEGTQ